MVADDASRPYHDARAVVDCEMVADSGGGMDVDTCLGMCHFRDDTRNQGHAQQKQFMGDAVIAQRLDDRVATDNFAVRFGCRVAVVGRFHIGSQHFAQGRQAADELSGQVDGLFAFGVACTVACFLGIEAQSGMYLFGQQVVHPLDVDSDMISDGMMVDRGFPVKSREKDGTAQFDNFVQDFSRREGVSVLMFMKQTFQGRVFG